MLFASVTGRASAEVLQHASAGPYIDTHDGGTLSCVDDIAATTLVPPTTTGVCELHVALRPTVTFGCDATGTLDPSTNMMRISVAGEASTDDPRANAISFQCIVVQATGEAGSVGLSTPTKSVTVGGEVEAPPGQYWLCATGFYRYVQNGQDKFYSFKGGC